VTWVENADLSGEGPAIPDWIVQVDGQGPLAEAGADSVALVELPAGTVGLLCAVGDWLNLTFMDGGAFALAE
jgi:hypothetical protein